MLLYFLDTYSILSTTDRDYLLRIIALEGLMSRPEIIHSEPLNFFIMGHSKSEEDTKIRDQNPN